MTAQPDIIELNDRVISYHLSLYNFVEDNGYVNWAIPALQLYFSSDSDESGRVMVEKSIQYYFNFFSKSLEEFTTQLNKTGFDVFDPLTSYQQLLDAKKVDIKFTQYVLPPPGYAHRRRIIHQQMMVA